MPSTDPLAFTEDWTPWILYITRHSGIKSKTHIFTLFLTSPDTQVQKA